MVTLSKSPLFEYGIPAKVQSYLAAGKPIIAAMDGAGKDLINKSGAGICVNSEDAKELASSFINLAQMKQSRRNEMGEKALAYHHVHYDRDKNMKRLEDLFSMIKEF
jgi:colanic acid biosynthesis glycosyl transferase WcaI